MKSYQRVGFALAMLVLVGCADDVNNSVESRDIGTASAQDAGVQDTLERDTTGGDDGGGWQDVLVLGDVPPDDNLDHRCGDAPVEDWPLNAVFTGDKIHSSDEAGVMTATVDARAGGTQAAATNSYIYLDLSTGEQVDVDDLTAFNEGDWDLGFKRVIIRTNGGDSGPGDVSVAKLTETTFEDVSAPPQANAAWAQDIAYDDDCALYTDPIGQPVTAFNYLNVDNATGSQSWYDYGGGIIPHPGDIYVVDVPSRQMTYKLELLSWDDGIFELKWAEL